MKSRKKNVMKTPKTTNRDQKLCTMNWFSLYSSGPNRILPFCHWSQWNFFGALVMLFSHIFFVDYCCSTLPFIVIMFWVHAKPCRNMMTIVYAFCQGTTSIFIPVNEINVVQFNFWNGSRLTRDYHLCRLNILSLRTFVLNI